MAEEFDIEAWAEINRVTQLYYPISFWVEGIIYGFYACLFFVVVGIMTKKKALDTIASRVFLTGIVMMFILATIHNIRNIYSLCRAYAYTLPPGVMPVYYFQDYIKWDNFAHPVILAILTWIGDILVIYRCFLIWRRNYYVIILPILLLLLSFATTAVNLYWFKNPTRWTWDFMRPFLNITFPTNLVQNILTTGLISFKIYMQHRESRNSGLLLSSGLDLVTVIRIIVESAFIYTTQMFVMMILFELGHPALVIVTHALVPSIGIVFALIAIRTHVARVDSAVRAQQSNSFFPSWLSDRNDRRPNMPIITTVTEEHHLDVMTTPSKIESEAERNVSYRSSTGTMNKTTLSRV